MPDTWGLARTAEGLFAHGEIDLATADPFEERATEAVMEAAGSSVLMDLSGVTFMDSTGLHLIVDVTRALTGGAALVLIGPTPPVAGASGQRGRQAKNAL